MLINLRIDYLQAYLLKPCFEYVSSCLSDHHQTWYTNFELTPFFIKTSYADSALNDYDSDFLNFHIQNTIRSVCLIHTWLDLEFRHTFDFLKSHSNRPERLADFVILEREGQWQVSMAFFGDGRGLTLLAEQYVLYFLNDPYTVTMLFLKCYLIVKYYLLCCIVCFWVFSFVLP